MALETTRERLRWMLMEIVRLLRALLFCDMEVEMRVVTDATYLY